MSEDIDNPLTQWAVANAADDLPMVVLPGSGVTITNSAEKLFKLIAPTHTMFSRGGSVMVLLQRDDGLLALDVLSPSASRSAFEKHARLMVPRTGKKGEDVYKTAPCSEDVAKALLNSQEANELLPRITGLINCPVMCETDQGLTIAKKGYDAHTGLLVTDGDDVPEVELEQAVSALLALFDDFDFQTLGDKSRAVASLITPALVLGGFLKHRVPADVAEADQSQSGKTYRQKIVAAVYGEKLSLISCRSGGVGSVDESFNQALISGRPFIQLDNFRGRFDSPHTEAFMTAEGSFPCRVPYKGEVLVQPEKFFIAMSSNGVDTTRDFANRSNIIRIQKKPPGYSYIKFEEGDLLDRVRFWQLYYLGCIFSVIREWHRQKKPVTNETRHDFREWCQVLDWICQNIFDLAPIMDGHREAQERVSDPRKVWIRKLVLAIRDASELEKPLTATDLQRICDINDIAIPGLASGADEDRAKRAIGTVLGKLYGAGNTLEAENFMITRYEGTVPRPDPTIGGGYVTKFYTVRAL